MTCAMTFLSCFSHSERALRVDCTNFAENSIRNVLWVLECIHTRVPHFIASVCNITITPYCCTYSMENIFHDRLHSLKAITRSWIKSTKLSCYAFRVPFDTKKALLQKLTSIGTYSFGI